MKTMTKPLGGAMALLLVGSLVTAGLPSPVDARSAPTSFADLIETASPAVVQITAERTASATPVPQIPEHFRDGPFRDFFDRYFGNRIPEFTPGVPRGAIGSGFVIDADGIIVTNHHVVAGASEITVTLRTGESLPATLIGSDDKTDLAVLRVEPEAPLPAVEWGDSDRTRVGDWVVAVGSPFGFGGTVTAGIVSARGRDLGAGPYDDFIQIDAPINSGNSGGPLFDDDGEVIGVNTAIVSPSGGNIGLGFAIPAKLAEGIVDQLVETGTVERGWLGVSVQPLTTDLAEQFGLEDEAGALVASVMEGGPAELAGLRAGDLILRFADNPVETTRDLSRAVGSTAPGSTVELVLHREGSELTLTVEIGQAKKTVADLAPSKPKDAG